MLKTGVKVHIPHIKIETPEDRTFWKAVGIEVSKDIVKRTQSGKDADNRGFKAYGKATIKSRVARGRTTKVNLTDTGRLMTSIPKGIRSSKNGVQLRLAGESGFKAYNIQEKMKNKRQFFALNEKQVIKIVRKIIKWMKKENK